MSNNYMTVFQVGTIEDAMRQALFKPGYDRVGVISKRSDFQKRVEYYCRGLGKRNTAAFLESCQENNVEFIPFHFKDIQDLEANENTFAEAVGLDKVGIIFVEDYEMTEYLQQKYKPEV